MIRTAPDFGRDYQQFDFGSDYRELVAARQQAAHTLFEAELALHDAHQTHVDKWIQAASDHLHVAVARHQAVDALVRRQERTIAA